MPSIEEMKHLQIPLHDVSLATNGFDKENCIGEGGFGPVYKGISEKHGCIAVKRLVHNPRKRQAQGDHEFTTEIALLSKYKHENIVSLLGFCDEDGEKILVYKYESKGSLDKHLDCEDLTWIQRLRICLDVAHGLKYVQDNNGSQLGIFHRDVKSSNILLDENWKAKISDFGLSKIRPPYSQSTFVFSHACGTHGYIDPDYYINGYLTLKSDIYSFGVVLFEVLCGRLTRVTSYNDDRQFLTVLVQKKYKRETLDGIIPSYLHKQISPDSLDKFSKIAYQCLKNVEERPTIENVVEQLQEALDHQLKSLCSSHKEVKRPGEEAKPTNRDKKKGEVLTDPTPSPPRKEIVMSMFMHCEACATQVKQCLKGFKGVEDVVTNCETHKVVVRGEKADPLKVLERVRKTSNRKVVLLSPVTDKMEEPSKSEEKKNEEVKNLEGVKSMEEPKPQPPLPTQEVVLKVFMDCEGCARKIRQCLKDFEGVEGVVLDCEKHMVVVNGKIADPFKVLERVQKNYHRKVEFISSVQKSLMDEPNKSGQEKPPKQGWKSWLQKKLKVAESKALFL